MEKSPRLIDERKWKEIQNVRWRDIQRYLFFASPPMLRHLAFKPGSFFNVYPSPFGSIELFAFGTAGCNTRGCGGFCVENDFLREMYVKTSHK